MTKILLWSISLLCPFALLSQNVIESHDVYISGMVTTLPHLNPLSGIFVAGYRIGQKNQAIYSTYTEENGQFFLEVDEVGTYEVTLQHLGYQSIVVKNIIVQRGQPNYLSLEMEASVKELPMPTVRSKKPIQKLPGAYALDPLAIQKIAGNYDDPGRVAMSLPGMVGTNDQGNGISSFGLHPQFTQWAMNGYDIVNPNHLASAGSLSELPNGSSGGVNMVTTQMLDQVNVYSTALPGNHMQSIGSVIDMQLRSGQNQSLAYAAQAGLLGMELLVEGPFSSKRKATYMISGRYSTVGLLEKVGVNFGNESIQFFDGAAHVAFPLRSGQINVFHVSGGNINSYNPRPDSDPNFSDKDLQSIQQNGQQTIQGIVWKHRLHTHFSLEIGSVYSTQNYAQEIKSDIQIRPINAWLNNLEQKNALWHHRAKITFSKNPNWHWWTQFELRQGLYKNFNFKQLHNTESWTSGTKYKPNSKWELNGMLHISRPLSSSFSSPIYLLPNFSTAYKASKNWQFSGHFGKYQQSLFELSNSKNLSILAITKSGITAQYLSEKGHVVFSQIGMHISGKSPNYFTTNALISPISESFTTINEAIPNATINQISPWRQRYITIGFTPVMRSGFTSNVQGTLYSTQIENANKHWISSRYGGPFQSVATLAWERKRMGKRHPQTISITSRSTLSSGGLRPIIDVQNSILKNTTVYNYSSYEQRNTPFFRSDLRLAIEKEKGQSTHIWSLDIQNVTNRANESHEYYDITQGKIMKVKQLTLIPIFSFRVKGWKLK